jgi:DNA-binding IclR family transcriptional regulator
MWVYINTEVAERLGYTKASIIEHFFTRNPLNNKANLNVSHLSTVLPISKSTATRKVKELVEENYLIKHGRSIYSLSPKFFTTFAEYNQILQETYEHRRKSPVR